MSIIEFIYVCLSTFTANKFSFKFNHLQLLGMLLRQLFADFHPVFVDQFLHYIYPGTRYLYVKIKVATKVSGDCSR